MVDMEWNEDLSSDTMKVLYRYLIRFTGFALNLYTYSSGQ